MTLRIRRLHRTRLKQGLFAVIGGLALALGATGQANAGPTPAEIEAQIDAQWNQLEPVLELADHAAMMSADHAGTDERDTQRRLRVPCGGTHA